ncbi:MAG: dephospho-CoA kinase [Arenimonas sp.]
MARFIVAVTGGIASGKSSVTELFSDCGIDIVDADIAARKIVESGQPALDEITRFFGPAILTDGQLNRQVLREIIFDHPEAKKKLESITHPRIRELLMRGCESATSPYAVVAIPLLAEGDKANYEWLDRIVIVDVTREIQKKRLLARDKIDDHLADKMLNAQATREQRLAIADDVISNMYDLDSLRATVERLDSRYRQLAMTAAAKND